MDRNFREAFAQLEKMGVPVIEGGDYGDEGTFRISGEDNHNGTVWADYWREFCDWDFGVNPEIEKVLSSHGLFCDWINPGVLGVYNI